VAGILGTSHSGVNNFSPYINLYVGLYTKLDVFFNNQPLVLADKVKQSKLRILKFIDPVHGFDKPVSRSYQPVIGIINCLTGV
jgi:hypothetical protein